MSDLQHSPRYRLYGLTLATDFPLRSHLLPSQETADLTFTLQKDPPFIIDWTGQEVQYLSENPELSIFSTAGVQIMRFNSYQLDFYLWPDRIICHHHAAIDPALIEMLLMGSLIPYHLELSGSFNLHAAANEVRGKAVAFIASNRGGKTSLAAALNQAGYPLISDDTLPIFEAEGTFWATPSYPQMRMWPEQARHFYPDIADLPWVHPQYPKLMIPIGENGFGSFCRRPQILSALFIPERSEGLQEIAIEALRPAENLPFLLENNRFTLFLRRKDDLQRRLDLTARLVKQVPLYRLRYPAGYEHLPGVVEAVLTCLGQEEAFI